MIHSYNQFHAAGHGTFFSGELKSDGGSDSFLWVYDCGSKIAGRMNDLIADLHAHAGTDVIDMLCISHFDDDHVNGLVDLLKLFSVKRLFLPYMPFRERLEIACQFNSSTGGSWSLALLALDPLAFLDAQGLGNKVEHIVLVEGGEAAAESPGLDIQDLGPNLPDEGGHQREGKASPPDYASLSHVGNVPSLSILSHSTPLICSQAHWEFMFYNRELPKLRRSHPKLNLARVQRVVRLMWRLLAKNAGGVAWNHPEWLAKLRRCYVHLFGKPQANDISLCLLSRPVSSGPYDCCRIFPIPSSRTGCIHATLPVPGTNKSALLLTGDVTITYKELSIMCNHFASRWDQVYLMQIPHHGSKNSWKALGSTMCAHDYSVFCVPDSSPSGHHPHIDVVADMASRHPVRANGSQSIVYSFHLRRTIPISFPDVQPVVDTFEFSF